MNYRQLNWTIAHDPCKEADRTPTKSIPAGTEVALTLRVEASARESVRDVKVLVGTPSDDEPTAFSWEARDMHANGIGYHATLRTSPWPHVFLYAFAIELANGATAYYLPRRDSRATAGEIVVDGIDGTWTDKGWEPLKNPDETQSDEQDYNSDRANAAKLSPFVLAEPLSGFQVTAYDPAFETPDWLAGAIMYQIFPDRFARDAHGVNAEGVAYRERMDRPVMLHENWDEPMEWEDPKGGNYDPIDFYGGTLAGIREKLPYLASLGVEALYLNPVFEARSNHRYDTADYERIDPLLGTNDDFSKLCEAAKHVGISIIFDAVLSHTGADSRYFNEQKTYAEPGALHDPESPFRSWYDFDHSSGKTPYRCWWGFPSLPEVDERNESWQHYMLGDGYLEGDRSKNFYQESSDDDRGIIPRWLAAGARGLRLDVADELPDDVLEYVRQSAKQAKADCAIIGEVWEDPTTKVSYDAQRTYALGRALDSVMNYPLRDALIGFALGTVDALQLATFLKLQQANYPLPMYQCLMNLLSSHDVERLRSVLALGGGCKNLSRKRQFEAVGRITDAQDEHAADLQRMLVGILYALPGTPCIYYGDERGLQGGGDPFCRATFPWNHDNDRRDYGCDLTEFYQTIGQLRKDSALLKRGNLHCCAPDDDVLCIVRTDSDTASLLIAIANRSSAARTGAFDLRALGVGSNTAKCELHPTFGSGNVWMEGGIVHFSVEALSAAYFE